MKDDDTTNKPRQVGKKPRNTELEEETEEEPMKKQCEHEKYVYSCVSIGKYNQTKYGRCSNHLTYVTHMNI